MTDPVDTAELRRCLEHSTPGEWGFLRTDDQEDGYSIRAVEKLTVTDFAGFWDAALIVALRNNAEALLDEVDRLRASDTGNFKRALGATEVLSLAQLHTRMTRAEAENRRLRHDGIMCEPCSRDDHQACTGACSSACCVIYDLEAENERLRALLAEAVDAYNKHDLWCGHNANAPGDPSHHVFARITDVLADRQQGEER